MQELVDALWQEHPPASAENVIHTYLKRLRRLLEPDRPPRAPSRLLRRVGNGYALTLSSVDLDLVRFQRLARAAGEAAEPATPTICAVTGTAGAGKTALVVRAAHRARARFPDGQLYVDLRGYGPEPPVAPAEALARLLRAIGEPDTAVPLDLDLELAVVLGDRYEHARASAGLEEAAQALRETTS
jgi:hypothetical protein